MADFNKAIVHVLESEGGYVNDADDRGGETKYGITKASYPDEDIANLSVERAKEIYKRDYWDKVGGDQLLDQAVAYNIFDTAINMGVSTASKMAQQLAHVSADGIIGSISIAAINNQPIMLFISDYKLAKVNRYRTICNADRSQVKFLLGWLNRVYSV